MPQDDANLRRSTRTRTQTDVLTAKTFTGKSYAQAVMQGVTQEKVSYAQACEQIDRIEQCHNLMGTVKEAEKKTLMYEKEYALLYARTICDMNEKFAEEGECFGQQYILEQGLKVFGSKGRDACVKEMDQMDKRTAFRPISIGEMSKSERSKAQRALMFLTEKRDGTIKGRMVYNGKPTRDYYSREEVASPTASLESILITGVIDAHEGRDVMTADVPNAFIQTEIPKAKDGEDRIIMKITGSLVDLLVKLNPEKYGPYVVFENGKKVLYVETLKAIYGHLLASILFYKKFRKDLEAEDFIFNPYDPCVANRLKEGKQQTVRFHVDDLMSSHINTRINDEFAKWLQNKYGTYGDVKVTRGKVHDYLGMILDFREDKKLIVDMTKYVKGMLDEFPIKFEESDKTSTPASDDLFKESTGKVLLKRDSEIFHRTVAKGLFLSKRGRPDTHPTIAALCTRVMKPKQSDWKKLIRMMKYLHSTRDLTLKLSADKLSVIKWYVDAAFAVHPDFKSHSGGIMTFGNGALQSISRKQKLNTRSSTEAEIVGVDDVATMICWTRLFLEKQGYAVDKNILYQDNKSAILLEENGQKSAGKRSRAMNIRYFFMTDQIEKGNVQVEYCPTDDMIGDYMSKPLQGYKFRKFRSQIMGEDVK